MKLILTNHHLFLRSESKISSQFIKFDLMMLLFMICIFKITITFHPIIFHYKSFHICKFKSEDLKTSKKYFIALSIFKLLDFESIKYLFK
jgi:hypothetical protein